MSLNNLANRLSDLGGRDQAEAAFAEHLQLFLEASAARGHLLLARSH